MIFIRQIQPPSAPPEVPLAWGCRCARSREEVFGTLNNPLLPLFPPPQPVSVPKWLPPPANGGSPAWRSLSLPALSSRGPAPGPLSLPSYFSSGRCHHVEASAATTDLPTPAAAPHATGRGSPVSRRDQPSQRRPPGTADRHRGSPGASRSGLSVPGACSRCRQRTSPRSRKHLSGVSAAAASRKARGSGYRQRQGTDHRKGTPTVTRV